MNASKILTIAVAFALLASTLMPIFGVGPVANAAAEDDTVKIGFLNPSTGPIAVYAEAFSDAAQIAIDHLNEDSTTHTFELVEADSGCDGTTAATAAQSLVDAGVVGIAGAACSGATLGAMEVAKAAGVPMVSYASTSPALTTADDGGYLFRVVPSDAQQGAALAATYGASGYESPALLSMTNDYGSGFAAAFKDNYDGDICAESTYADDATDFSSMVETVISSDCDSVVMITYATDGAAIVEELATQEFDGMIFGGDGIADITFANEFSDASSLEGLTVTKPAAAADSPLGMLFDSIYYPTAEAMGYEGGIYTKEVFDAVAIIGLAQATAYRTPITTDGVVDQLGVNVAGPDAPQPGASGVHVFDANGDVGGSGFEVCTFWIDEEDNTMELYCHSTWNLFEGLMDYGIPTMEDDEDACPFTSDAGLALCEAADADEDHPCDADTAAGGEECGKIVKELCDENEDIGCDFFYDATVEESFASICVNGVITLEDSELEDITEWDTAFCKALHYTAPAEEEEEVVEEEETQTNETVTEEDIEDVVDEVPGFGLISAVAAIGAVLLLRRRL